MRHASDMGQRILVLAKDLIAQGGYNSLSYRELSRHLGIKTASIHYHYAEKSALGEAVIQSHYDTLLAESELLLKSDKSALQKLERCFELAHIISQSGDKICLLGILEAEFETYPERMQEAVRRLALFHRQLAAHVLEQGREQGVLRFAGPPLAQATLVVTAVQGALQLARALKEPDVLSTTIEQLKAAMSP